MEEIGLVVDKNEKNKTITVKFSRKAQCESCNMCIKHKDDTFVRCVVKNTKNADIGDEVAVNMEVGYVMLSAAIVYLIPLLLSGLSLLCTRKLIEWQQIVIFCAVLVFSFGVVSLLDKIVGMKKGFKPEITKIVSKRDIGNDNLK